MRTYTRPPSLFLARIKLAATGMLYCTSSGSAASPELSRREGPGTAHAAHASIRGSPMIPLDQPIRKSPVAVLWPVPGTSAPLTPALQPLSPITCARTLPPRAQGCGTWLDRVRVMPCSHVRGPSRNSRIVHAWLTRIWAIARRVPSTTFPDSLCGRRSSQRQTLRLSGGLMAHVRRQWLQLLGGQSRHRPRVRPRRPRGLG